MDPNTETQYEQKPSLPPDYKGNPLSVMQEGEAVICEIKRHPIGLFGMYFSVGLGLLFLLTLAIIIPKNVDGINSQAQAFIMIGFIIVAGVALLSVAISASVYKNNRWILTTDSLTQVNQISLFRKETSQLSLANLEDVTAEQNGVLQSMFNFGSLHAETAGEKSRFIFRYCPDPNYYARQILACREAFISKDPEGAKRANHLLNLPT
jgi:hypothetical protein